MAARRFALGDVRQVAILVDVEAVFSRRESLDFARDANPVTDLLEDDEAGHAAFAHRVQDRNGGLAFLGHFAPSALGLSWSCLTDENDCHRQQTERAKPHELDPFRQRW